jgi:hypothetical protein
MAFVTVSIQIMPTETISAYVLISAMIARRNALKTFFGGRFFIVKLRAMVDT